MSWRRWCGWEPREWHRPQPDGTVLVTREVEWDQRSREIAVALVEYEDRLCPGCGTDLAETTLPDRDPMDREWAYEAKPPVRCYKCTAISRAAEPYHKDSPHPHALHFPVLLHVT